MFKIRRAIRTYQTLESTKYYRPAWQLTLFGIPLTPYNNYSYSDGYCSSCIEEFDSYSDAEAYIKRIYFYKEQNSLKKRSLKAVSDDIKP